MYASVAVSFDELFDNSHVISCNPRRMELLEHNFTKYGLPVPKLFPAIIRSDMTGTQNSSLSHAAVIQEAKDNGRPLALIFEDDAYPCKDILYKMKHITVPQYSDICLLGHHKTNVKATNNWNLVGMKDYAWGAHAYIIWAKAYDRVLKMYEERPIVSCDGVWGKTAKIWTNCWLRRNPWFIQYNEPTESSNFRHYGYVINGNHMEPPVGFDYVDKI